MNEILNDDLTIEIDPKDSYKDDFASLERKIQAFEILVGRDNLHHSRIFVFGHLQKLDSNQQFHGSVIGYTVKEFNFHANPPTVQIYYKSYQPHVLFISVESIILRYNKRIFGKYGEK